MSNQNRLGMPEACVCHGCVTEPEREGESLDVVDRRCGRNIGVEIGRASIRGMCEGYARSSRDFAWAPEFHVALRFVRS
jgi:hypothetical protein